MSSVALVLSITGFCFSYSSQLTGGNLYVSDCHQDIPFGGGPSPISGPSYIHTIPAHGGAVTANIVSTVTDAITSVVAISDTGENNILYRVDSSSGGLQNGLYVISDHGGTPQQVLATPDESVVLNAIPNYAHSITSFDNSQFAVKVVNTANTKTIRVHSISSTTVAETIATADGSNDLTVVGWTRY